MNKDETFTPNPVVDGEETLRHLLPKLLFLSPDIKQSPPIAAGDSHLIINLKTIRENLFYATNIASKASDLFSLRNDPENRLASLILWDLSLEQFISAIASLDFLLLQEEKKLNTINDENSPAAKV